MGKRRQRLSGRMRFGERVAVLISISCLGLVGLVNQGHSAAGANGALESNGVDRPQRLATFYARLPLSFEPNRGQTDGRVKFLARGLGYTLFLTSNAAVLALRSRQLSVVSRQLQKTKTADHGPRTTDSVLQMKLLGANRTAKATGLEELPARANYFIGNDPKKWRTDVPTYAKVKDEGVYPGIDLVYYGHQGQLEYDFVVEPGADPKAIRLGIEAGKSRVAIDAYGDLVIETDGGEVRLHKPVVYQPKGPLKSQFRIQNSELLNGRYALTADKRVSFEVEDYDRSRPLIIDPVLSYSTYLGGTGGDVANGIAVDSSGNAYVTGSTASSDFPVKSAEQGTYAGNGDAFVAKFNATGSGLVFSTFLGGSGSDSGAALAVDLSGNSYVVGNTSSINFPTTSGAFQPNYAGNGDGFVVKLSASGSSLIYSSYLGGSDGDFAQAIALDSSGNAYVTGSTRSADFPTAKPLQIGNDGQSDAFVTKVNPSGTGLVYSTYLGGSSADSGQAIAVDGAGNAYVTGFTFSKDFPTQNALQGANAGGLDAFVTELNSAGSGLVFSTYLGGSAQDRAFGLAVDAHGSVYVTGDTQSNDFPTTTNAFQTSNHGQGDAFVSKLAPGGSSLVYSTLLGGSGTDQANGIAVDSSGDAAITGFTQSSDFPTANPLQRILGVSGAGLCGSTLCADAFVTELGPSGALVYSTYLGGSGADFGQAIALDSSGAVYMAGSTTSPNFPVIAGASQGTFSGTSSNSTAFVAKVNNVDASGMALTPQQLNFGNQALNSTSNPRAVTLINAGSAPLNISSIVAGTAFAETNNCGTVVPAGGGSCTIQVTFTPTVPGATTDQITITDNANGSPHAITVTGSGVTSAGSLSISPTSLTFPPETVGVTSPSQIVRLTNTGQTVVNLTGLNITGDFSQTNTCGTLPTFLNVGNSCTVSITFTPIGTGNRTGTLSLSDDAAGNPQTVSLNGTGNPVFSLSASTRSTVITIGTTSATFTVSATAPSSFINSIALSCAPATCSFNPSSITAGQSSTVTVTGLSATSANPLNFSVTGTSGVQTATLALTVFFADFSVSASPALGTVTAGQSSTFTVTASPVNGFNQVVVFGCIGLPQAASCSFSPPATTLNGATAATATLTVSTTPPSARSGRRAPPNGTFFGSGEGRWKWTVFLAFLALWVAALRQAQGRERSRTAATARGRRRTLRPALRFAALTLVMAFVILVAGCNEFFTPIVGNPTATGTPPGVHTITITGTLGTNSNVTRTTTVRLAVG